MRLIHHIFRPRPLVTAGLMVMAAGSIYLSLALFLRIDGYLFPGNELSVPNVGAFVPGTGVRVEVGLPGISSETEPPWTPDDRLTVLVLGLDRRPYEPEDGSYRSDSMFVANIDRRSGDITLFHIPRDLWVDVPVTADGEVWAKAKINAAYANGQQINWPGGPGAASIAAVERHFSIDIDHYVVVDWTDFTGLVDALGGLDIAVSEPIYDLGTGVLNPFATDVLQPGIYHMSGQQALAYSRVRTDNDLKRIERQQTVIRAVATRMLALGLTSDVAGLWDAYRDTFDHNVGAGQIPGFGLLAGKLDYENIDTFTLNTIVYGAISEDGQAILLAPEEPVYAVVDEFLADSEMRRESPRISIAFPPGSESLADELIAHLGEYGIPAPYIEAMEWTCECAPGVYNLTTKTYTQEKVAALTDLPALLPDPDLPQDYDVVIRLGAELELVHP